MWGLAAPSSTLQKQKSGLLERRRVGGCPHAGSGGLRGLSRVDAGVGNTKEPEKEIPFSSSPVYAKVWFLHLGSACICTAQERELCIYQNILPFAAKIVLEITRLSENAKYKPSWTNLS